MCAFLQLLLTPPSASPRAGKDFQAENDMILTIRGTDLRALIANRGESETIMISNRGVPCFWSKPLDFRAKQVMSQSVLRRLRIRARKLRNRGEGGQFPMDQAEAYFTRQREEIEYF